MKKILLILVSILFVAVNAYAGLVVRPAKSQIVMDKENVFSGKYTIINDNDSTVVVTITTEDWNNSPNNKDVHVNEWLEVKKKTITLAPREQADIEYTAKSANYEGSLSGMVSFTYRSPNASNINLMTSVPVYMTIRGTEKIEYIIESLAVNGAKAGKNPYIQYVVKNDGNVPLRLIGNIKIVKGKKTVFENRIREQNPVYAGGVRSFIEDISALGKGKYILTISLNAYDKNVEKSCQFRVNKYGDISY